MEKLDGEKKIKGDGQIINYFGRWPSFHDAAIVSVRIKRKGKSVTIKFRMNEMVSDERQSGLANLVLRWKGVEEIILLGLHSQNWIWGMSINQNGKWFDTAFQRMDGTHGTIRSRSIQVLHFKPKK